MAISVITPTGCRPACLDLCEKWLKRQTYRAFEWIVVDDGEPYSRADAIHPEPAWREGENTLGRNLRAGIEAARHDRIAIVEDDDWYAPEYLETINAWLDEHDAVGEGQSRYFNIRSGIAKEFEGTKHASLNATAIRGDSARAALTQASRAVNIDLEFWRIVEGGKVYPYQGLVVGIKGMPGRPGIGVGHRMTGTDSPEKLAQWIGKDADLYASFRL